MRIEVAVLGKPNAALRLDGRIGLEFMNAIHVADFGFESETMRCFGDLGFFVEALLRLAEHEETFLDEGEVFFFGELDVKATAEKGEVAK